MDEKVLSRSGQFIDENGNTEFWWNGTNYGCIIPEELIDLELAASNYSREDGGSNNVRNNIHG